MDVKMRVYCRYLKLRLKDGSVRRLKRGDEIHRGDVDPGSAAAADTFYGPRDGSEALKKMIAAARKEGRDEHGRWKGIEEPAWFRSQTIPAWSPVD